MTETRPVARDYWDDRGAVLLWAAVLLAPAAWAFNQFVGYALVKPVCASGHKIVLIGISAAALAIVSAGEWIAWSCFRRLRQADEEGASPADRSYFMAVVAMGFNFLVAILILTAAVSPFVLSPCE